MHDMAVAVRDLPATLGCAQVRELLESVLPFHASTFNMDKIHIDSK